MGEEEKGWERGYEDSKDEDKGLLREGRREGGVGGRRGRRREGQGDRSFTLNSQEVNQQSVNLSKSL